MSDTVTGREIAVEISSVWRSKEAGREDREWGEWTERVRAIVRGSVHGEFHVYTPLRVVRGWDPKTFAYALVTLIVLHP